ncbi:hypothetical protein H4R21_003140 [Coemansia helicoidea]|uniref:Uncharacterized protein n=1 Tax=Coemansia helicoidea TaxID=1286919 RepID=A0ACC1L4W5_9FUNG|nr:hypothetical protein H4R21_003140 [Coemansia helicoidea]
MTSETAAQQQGPRPGRGRKSRRSRKSGAGGSRRGAPSALQDGARSYALRHQQRNETNAVAKWFIDRFYFPDPTQVPPSPPSEPAPNELHNLDSPR